MLGIIINGGNFNREFSGFLSDSAHTGTSGLAKTSAVQEIATTRTIAIEIFSIWNI